MSFIDLCISDFNIVEFISLWTLQKVTDFPSAKDTGLSEDATKQANKAVAWPSPMEQRATIRKYVAINGNTAA